MRLTFEPLYFGERLHVVNPEGDIGLITLWSPWETTRRKLDEIAPEILDPSRSRVAVVGNLYGDGMYAMLCNLLHNPQVRHLIALGTQAGPSTTDDLEVFFDKGLEDVIVLDAPMRRIPGSSRLFPADPAFDAERLRRALTFTHLGRLSEPRLPERLRALLVELPRAQEGGADDRVRVSLDLDLAADRRRQPSAVETHQITRRAPAQVWEELVVRTMRFGQVAEVGDGVRLELLNVKAVVLEPEVETAEALERFDIRLGDLLAYQRRILDPAPPDGVAYTYGHRLRGFRPLADGRTDTLAEVIDLLRAHPDTRRAYITLWDNPTDLHAPRDGSGSDVATPCLTTVWMRISEGALTLTATYRSHNLLTAWLQNVYGLMAIQRHVAAGIGAPAGPLTVVSHSLGINPADSRYPIAERVVAGWHTDDDVDPDTRKTTLREDPNGYFIVTTDLDAGEVVAQHRYEGILMKEYRAPKAAEIIRQVGADMAVSLVSHALWLGGELRRAEDSLTTPAR